MALARTKKEARRVAAAEVALKIRLAVQFKAEIGRVLNRIADDFYVQFAANGSLIDTGNYRAETEAALNNHYRRVAHFFNRSTRDTLPKCNIPWTETKELADQIDADVNVKSREKAAAQAVYLLQTTQKQLREGLDNVVNTFLSSGMDLENVRVAEAVYQDVRAGNPGRAENISATETSAAAELFKQVEVGYVAVALSNYFLGKEWVSRLNEATRTAHALADGQTVGINDLFTVAGEKLLFPGDTSHGAGIGNTINCYCTVVYVLMGAKKMTERLEFKCAVEGIKQDDAYYYVKGYASTHDLDLTNDIVAPGAFADSLAVRKPKMFLHHKWDEPAGVWDLCEERADGLYVEGRIPKTAQNENLGALLKMGAFGGFSIGFDVVEYTRDNNTGVRTLLKVNLWEISLVTIPANPQAKIVDFKGKRPQNFKELNQYLAETYGLGRSARNDVIGIVKHVLEAPSAKSEVNGLVEEIKRLTKDLSRGDAAQ